MTPDTPTAEAVCATCGEPRRARIHGPARGWAPEANPHHPFKPREEPEADAGAPVPDYRRARGVSPLEPGDPLPEEAIRRIRDVTPAPAAPPEAWHADEFVAGMLAGGATPEEIQVARPAFLHGRMDALEEVAAARAPQGVAPFEYPEGPAATPAEQREIDEFLDAAIGGDALEIEVRALREALEALRSDMQENTAKGNAYKGVHSWIDTITRALASEPVEGGE